MPRVRRSTGRSAASARSRRRRSRRNRPQGLLRSLIKRPVDRLKFVVLVFAHGSPVSSIAFRRPTLGPILNDGWQIERGAQPPRAALIEHRMGRRRQKVGTRLEIRDPLVEGDFAAAGNEAVALALGAFAERTQ